MKQIFITPNGTEFKYTKSINKASKFTNYNAALDWCKANEVDVERIVCSGTDGKNYLYSLMAPNNKYIIIGYDIAD